MKSHKSFQIRNTKRLQNIKYYLIEEARFKAESRAITAITDLQFNNN